MALLASTSSRCVVASRPARPASRCVTVSVRAFQVTLETPQGERKFQCQNQDKNLLEAALSSGVELPHLCRTGTCGVCAARVVSGTVERDDFLLDDLQSDAGFVLMCATKPTSDVVVRTEQEKELHTIPYNL